MIICIDFRKYEKLIIIEDKKLGGENKEKVKKRDMRYGS
jgi:hypothetical protein